MQQELDAITELPWHYGWVVNSKKIQGPPQEVKYLSISWTWGVQQIPEKALASIMYQESAATLLDVLTVYCSPACSIYSLILANLVCQLQALLITFNRVPHFVK